MYDTLGIHFHKGLNDLLENKQDIRVSQLGMLLLKEFKKIHIAILHYDEHGRTLSIINAFLHFQKVLMVERLHYVHFLLHPLSFEGIAISDLFDCIGDSLTGDSPIHHSEAALSYPLQQLILMHGATENISAV